MNTSNTDRPKLKSYFVTNAVPTQDQFEELIEASFNQSSDGLAKSLDTSLCIQASNGNSQEVLDLYRDFLTRKPDWRFELNPLRAPAEVNSSNPGLALRDEAGRVRLYFNQSEALAGIGTLDPRGGMHIVMDMGEQRNVGTEVAPVMEPWAYQGLENDVKIALILGDNDDGQIGAMKLYGHTRDEFAFVRPGSGDLFLDTTSANFFFNYDEMVRRNNNAVMHLANANGDETVRLDTQGNSWFNGGRLGIGTQAPTGKVQVVMQDAQGLETDLADGKVALVLGNDISNGALLMQGATALDKVYQHGHGGRWQLDASAGQYRLNLGKLAEGVSGVLEIGDENRDAGVRLQTGGHSFLKSNLSVGTDLNAAALHVMPSGLEFGGLLIEQATGETLRIDHQRIQVENGTDNLLLLQSDGSDTKIGGGLIVDGGLTVDGPIDTSRQVFFGIGKDPVERTLSLMGEEGVSIQRAGAANIGQYQRYLELGEPGQKFTMGMEFSMLHFGSETNQKILSMESEGRVSINQEETLDVSLAVRGRMDVTGVIGANTYGEYLPLNQVVGSQQNDIPAQLVLSSVQSELAIASLFNGGASTFTMAMYDPGNPGNAYRFELVQDSNHAEKLSWNRRRGGQPGGNPLDDWRMLDFDGEQRRVGIGRGSAGTALDIAGSGTPDFGVQVMVREAHDFGPGNDDSKGVTIGFASPHFGHPNVPAYDFFDPNNEILQNSPLPVLGYIGLIGTKENFSSTNPEEARLQVATLYDMPIEVCINEMRYMRFAPDQNSGIVQIGEPSMLIGLEVNGDSMFNEAATFSKAVRIAMATTLEGGLTITAGGAEINGLLEAKNQAIVHNGLAVETGRSELKGGLTVSGGSTTFTTSVDLQAGITGLTVLSGGADITGTLTASGSVNVGGGLSVTGGGANISGTLNLGSNAVIANGLKVEAGGAEIDGNLLAKAEAIISSGLTVSAGGAEINGPLLAKNNATINGNLEVATGTSKLLGGLEVSGGASLGGMTTFMGIADVKEILMVDGQAQLNGGAIVGWDVEVDGKISYTAPFMERGHDSFTVNTGSGQWEAVTFESEQDTPGMLEIEIWEDSTTNSPELYARIKCFVGKFSGALDYQEIEIYQDGIERFIADFQVDNDRRGIAIWFKAGDYKFRSNDPIQLFPGLTGIFSGPNAQPTFNGPVPTDYDHNIVQLGKGALAVDRFVAL